MSVERQFHHTVGSRLGSLSQLHKHHPSLSLLDNLTGPNMLVTQRHSVNRVVLVVTKRVATSGTHKTRGVISQQQSSVTTSCLQTLTLNALTTSRTNGVVGVVVALLAVWPVVMNVELESLSAGEVVVASVALEAFSVPSPRKRILGRNGFAHNHLVAASAGRLSLLFLAAILRGRRFALECERRVGRVRLVLLHRHQRHGGRMTRVHGRGSASVDAHVRQRRVYGVLGRPRRRAGMCL
jgi:hypothetical protein